MKLSYEEFIKRANLTHNNKFDYSKIEYNNLHDKIEIICPIHGSFFQTANSHLRGSGCRKCSYSITTKEDFVQKAHQIHNNFYNYDEFDYQGTKIKGKIICPIHGEFWQTPDNHIHNKRKCPECVKNKDNTLLKNKDIFIKKASSIHNNEYDYSQVIYTGNHDPIIVICPIHGPFSCIPSNHIRGHKCPYCAGNKLNKQLFIEKAQNVHVDKYDYSKVEENFKDKIEIICPIHGSFFQKSANHLMGNGCPHCVSHISKAEQEIVNFLQEHDIKVETNVRHIDGISELDIFLPEYNIAIEYNGNYWHSDEFKDKNFHLNKTIAANKQNIHLIHIFETDWIKKNNIWKSILLNQLQKNKIKIFARQTEIRNVSYTDARDFLNKNHLQGNCISKVRYGLYSDNELISLITFGRLRNNLNQQHQDDHYELLRFCNRLNCNVIGGASKLFKHFIKEHKPIKIISYCNRSHFTGKLYEKLGFIKTSETEPGYFYVKNNIRYNRYMFRKEILIKNGEDESLTEKEIMNNNNFHRIHDCGNIKYEYDF